MKEELQKYAERRMPLFALYTSLWSHSQGLKNSIGIGFSKSVFIHEKGTCILLATKSEIEKVTERILYLVKKDSSLLYNLYTKAKLSNKQANRLLDQYRHNSVNTNVHYFKKAYKVYAENFNLCTVLPYWVLFAMNKALEQGESKKTFRKFLGMYEELKSKTTYPQLLDIVFLKYFKKSADILHSQNLLATCLTPFELVKIMKGQKTVSLKVLRKRWKKCFLQTKSKPLLVHISYSFNVLYTRKLPSRITELKGTIAYRGKVRSVIKIINTPADIHKLIPGDVLVSIQSNPSLMSAIKKCSAIVTDEGGIMCHASIISRELRIPCIIGTKIATKILKDGDMVEVDADKGVVRKI